MCVNAGGCDFPIDPRQSSLETAIYWQPEVDPGTVILTARVPMRDVQATSLPQFDPSATRQDSDGTSISLLARTLSLRLLLLDAARPDSPLAAIIPLDPLALDRIEALTRLGRALNGQTATPYRRLTMQRRRRLRQMVQAVDGYLDGATYREIAKVLYGTTRVGADTWKTSSLRDSTIALVRDGRALIDGGYVELLKRRRRR